MKMTKEQLKEFWERDKKFREEEMSDKLKNLTKQTEWLQQDIKKWNKEMSDNKLSKGEEFNYIIAKVKDYTENFDIERMVEIQNQWEKANAILANINYLEE